MIFWLGENNLSLLSEDEVKEYGIPNMTKKTSIVQKYKGRGCCTLKSAKVQRSWMLQT